VRTQKLDNDRDPLHSEGFRHTTSNTGAKPECAVPPPQPLCFNHCLQLNYPDLICA